MSKDRSDQHWVRRRCVTHFIWAAAIIVWSIPLVAQHWTSQMAWSLADFGMFGGLVAGVALALVHVSQSPHPWSYRLAAVIAAATAATVIFVNAAVGLVGADGADANLMFFPIAAAAVAGGVFWRQDPHALARLFLGVGATQIGWSGAVILFGLIPESGRYIWDGFVSATLFGGFWLFAALLFRRTTQA